MKRIKITVGTYGYRRKNDGPIEAIDKNSVPIDVVDEEAERLVGLGVAEYAGDTTGNLDDGQLADLSMKELQKLAKDMGLKANGSKEELIARITAEEVSAPAEDGEQSEDGETEEPPVLTAVDPE